ETAGIVAGTGATLIRYMALATAFGALCAYFADPTMGRTRRAKTVDQIAGLGRRRAREIGRVGRGVAGAGYGLTQRVAHLRLAGVEPIDDADLAHRVMSEIFRDPSLPKG